jgi:hypothetical protein
MSWTSGPSATGRKTGGAFLTPLGATNAAALRHLIRWWRGEKIDPDSGLPHLAHAACSIFFLLEKELEGVLK